MIHARKPVFSLLGPVAILIAGCGVSAGYAVTPLHAVDCEVRATSSGNATLIEAVAHGLDAASGEYRFQVTASGNGGSTNIRQAGDFDVAAGASRVVGTARLAAGSAYDATLDLTAGGNVVECRGRS